MVGEREYAVIRVGVWKWSLVVCVTGLSSHACLKVIIFYCNSINDDAAPTCDSLIVTEL